MTTDLIQQATERLAEERAGDARRLASVWVAYAGLLAAAVSHKSAPDDGRELAALAGLLGVDAGRMERDLQIIGQALVAEPLAGNQARAEAAAAENLKIYEAEAAKITAQLESLKAQRAGVLRSARAAASARTTLEGLANERSELFRRLSAGAGFRLVSSNGPTPTAPAPATTAPARKK